mmetsp:Transcript_4965/g.14303  ORF Transcript_4965/g.14303 Transcript_4965/m.14303 type:complete len:158 (-) Transcript_4965:331-804(-)
MKARSLQRAPQHNARIAAAHTGKQHTLGTRYAIAVAHLGQRRSLEVRAAMRRGWKLRREALAQRDQQDPKLRQDSRVAGASRPDDFGTKASSLVMEKVVLEMQQLRREISTFLEQHQQQHGYKPALSETEKTFPHLFRKFTRYVGLQNYVRNVEEQQ